MKNSKRFPVSGEVRIFQVDNPWVYVGVPKKYTDDTKHLADRGLVAIVAKVGKSTWNTSLMPMGDGTQFIPLPAKVKKIRKGRSRRPHQTLVQTSTAIIFSLINGETDQRDLGHQ